MRSPALSPADLAAFEQQGWLRLEGFHPRRHVAGIRQQLLDELKRLGIWSGGRPLSRQFRDLPPFQQTGRIAAAVRVPGLHEALVTPGLGALVGEFARGARVDAQATQLLLSLPHQADWTLQGLNWHVDVAAGPRDPLPGVQAFVLVDDLAPRGGATLALAGSHREDRRAPAGRAPLRELLKASRALESDLKEIGVGIVEMAGRAGDVYLMDMRVLHAPSINATRNLRMMATTRFFFAP